jgi:hypothetical protein
MKTRGCIKKERGKKEPGFITPICQRSVIMLCIIITLQRFSIGASCCSVGQVLNLVITHIFLLRPGGTSEIGGFAAATGNRGEKPTSPERATDARAGLSPFQGLETTSPPYRWLRQASTTGESLMSLRDEEPETTGAKNVGNDKVKDLSHRMHAIENRCNYFRGFFFFRRPLAWPFDGPPFGGSWVKRVGLKSLGVRSWKVSSLMSAR